MDRIFFQDNFGVDGALFSFLVPSIESLTISLDLEKIILRLRAALQAKEEGKVVGALLSSLVAGLDGIALLP